MHSPGSKSENSGPHTQHHPGSRDCCRRPWAAWEKEGRNWGTGGTGGKPTWVRGGGDELRVGDRNGGGKQHSSLSLSFAATLRTSVSPGTRFPKRARPGYECSNQLIRVPNHCSDFLSAPGRPHPACDTSSV